MSTSAAIFHLTRYDYDRRVQLFPQIVRLRPAPHTRTSILSYSLKVFPEQHFINWQQDPFGNYLARLVFPEKTDRFEVQVDLVADLEAINPFDFFLDESAFNSPFSYDKELKEELEPYLQRVEGGSKFAELVRWAKDRFTSTAGVQREEDRLQTIDFLVEINQRINAEVGYTVRMEPGVQTPEETLSIGTGSCRDSGWLLVAVLRELGLAARFVSGYLIQLKADRKSLEGPSGPEEDFTDLHAWAEVYAPGAGWIGLDPTSGLFASEGHIPLAATPKPSSAAPISGATEKAEAKLHFDMKVSRVLETPRVTKPLDEGQVEAVINAGAAIDEILNREDVRLTLGGEPTFVATTDRDAGEWNIDAVGPTKRAFADRYLRRLQERFAPNGFLHHGQGKWYPGESLPRWAFALYWRTDGEPTWEAPEMIAREDQPKNATIDQAQLFAEGLAESLGLEADYATPAFEDPAEFMLREQKLAPNVDPIDNKLDDVETRTRLARVFDRGLESPAAFILPLQLAQAPARASKEMKQLARKRKFRWQSEKWQTRRQRLFLMPGDSPAGFRLPLQSLAHLPKNQRPEIIPLDPFAPREQLPTKIHHWEDRPISNAQAGEFDIPLVPIEEPGVNTNAALPGGPFSAGPAVRTALTVEPRNGILCAFMPPTATADEYIDIVNALEETALRTGIAIQIEGYPPPDDPRLNVIKVTPDPGVIEVNIQPAHNWAEQVDITRAVYEEAEKCGLEASKFMLDGRPTGSGGGAHVVVGGATPSDSPFLRRPDVLGSLIRYWQNHPSLSYFFSGMFIGPTSQAPRVDEGRESALYDLDIALSKLPHPEKAMGGECPPWLVDRLFRNLLVDVAGNTHRAEICIDKLYSPDGPTGRLGLVEFRAFEMPPHEDMNLAQQLILRALIAWFWKNPYTRPLNRFGTALHDRFMLPYYLRADLNAVLDEVSTGLGVRLDPSWYDAQFEFRFPHYGTIRHGGVDLELRAGLECWPVLGEEGSATGTARFVDSSVERLQVKVTGDFADRFDVSCNGYRVPLHDTERSDQRVAGVRFRTWLPSSALHPTIQPHAPLIFDIVDRAAGRSVGGCTYHATHPGGRNFEFRPVNSLEAEGRRRARFERIGHTPGPFHIYEPIRSEEYPTTLDLMRQ
ncbi:transglutaminase family protein [Parvularcula sp. LCG005]|uniref:transglutaminase family protein n=1 Tax=Parvularcula sp. LCG005 TaxID=3078805 RepID=UPI002942D6DF|nr:transglutaminase family protein [Parvularcula sp. LCG005]WOI51995.1 transglutaminase family protein [Parvularcula sp. LCG005]